MSPMVSSPSDAKSRIRSVALLRIPSGNAEIFCINILRSTMTNCWLMRANQHAALAVGATAHAERKPSSRRPVRSLRTISSGFPNSFRLAVTSRTSVLGRSSAVAGVNWDAHAASPNMASVSALGSRDLITRSGSSAKAAFSCIPC